MQWAPVGMSKVKSHPIHRASAQLSNTTMEPVDTLSHLHILHTLYHTCCTASNRARAAATCGCCIGQITFGVAAAAIGGGVERRLTAVGGVAIAVAPACKVSSTGRLSAMSWLAVCRPKVTTVCRAVGCPQPSCHCRTAHLAHSFQPRTCRCHMWVLHWPDHIWRCSCRNWRWC